MSSDEKVDTDALNNPDPATKSASQESDEKDTSARGIVKLLGPQVRLFHTPGREAFVTFYVQDHWEACRIKSAAFQDWVFARCYHREGFVPNQKTVAEVMSTLAGHALFGSPEEQAYVRVAGHDGAIYVDLANSSWEIVRITAGGWEIVSHSPVKFVRPDGTLPLPRPIDCGSIDELRPFLNITDEDHFKMAVAWMIGSLRPIGPFPIGILEGTHGSAKSTGAKVLRSLIDPNTAPLRSEPKNIRDLSISAANSWCLGYDNLSSIKPWLSDGLCRLSTGSGFATRTLYTDGGEKIFEGMRPLLLNGIDIGIEREDLLDRSISIFLSPISEESRKTEAEFWKGFEAARPSIFGSLLDGVACALRRLPEGKPSRLPRMADFAQWICAAQPAFGWPEGSVLEAYQRNREDLNGLALESSPLVAPIVHLTTEGTWEGTATDLQAALRQILLEKIPAEPITSWPGTPKELSQAIRRIAPNLLQIGIAIEFGRTAGNNSIKTITIKRHATVRRRRSEAIPNEGDHATQRLKYGLLPSPSFPSLRPRVKSSGVACVASSQTKARPRAK